MHVSVGWVGGREKAWDMITDDLRRYSRGTKDLK